MSKLREAAQRLREIAGRLGMQSFIACRDASEQIEAVAAALESEPAGDASCPVVAWESFYDERPTSGEPKP